MEPITWSEDFSVGVKLFDMQHKRLVGMLNMMITDPKATTQSETVSEVLTNMTRYAQEHFKAEEDLMKTYGYPLLEEHEGQHLVFKKKVAELCMATSDGIEEVPQILIAYLHKWLSQHILNEDMAYKRFFKEKGVW